ncbi:MAG: AAA family ATPase [Lachnospiraceae bacterium]|nr:AAA family ATPase [Lachnospiraceae bacterium]
MKQLKQESEEPKMVWPEEIAGPLKKKIFGQDEVIDEIARKIVINKMRKDKKLLVMVFIGPTATGKSETAKSLSEILSDCYETPYGYIEIAGNEFISEHTINRFFGAPPGYVGYGKDPVLAPVRKNPRHVIVINEVEKANTKLLEGLMEAIDTGYLGMADNSKPIDLNECILCFTSNIPVNQEGFDKMSRYEREEVCRDAFTKHSNRPEISGKIGNFVVFNDLSDTASMEIVVKFIKEELGNYSLGLTHIDECLMVDFLKHQTKYGARGIRSVVRDSIGEHLLKGRKLEELKDRSVSLKGTIDHIEFEIA